MKKIQKIIFTLIYTFLVMTAGFAANYTWTGTQSTEWTDYRNWNKNGSPAGPGEKPTTGDDVKIPQTSTKPVITGDALPGNTLNLTINKLTLEENAILTLILKNGDVNFTCTNGITSEDVNTPGAEPGKIRVQHHSTSPGEGSGTKDLAWLAKPSGASGAKIALTEVSSSGYKTRTVTLFNIDSVKDAVIEPSPWAADICVLKLDSDIKIRGSLNNKGTTTYNGTFKANGKTVTFNGSSSAIEGTGDISFHNLIVESGKSLTLKSNINISGTFTKNGEFQVNDNTTVTFIGSDSKIAGTSVPTFWSLTIASGAKLTLEKDIKIAGTFTNNQNFAHGNKAVTFVGFGSKITGTATETEFSTLAIDKRELPAPPPYNKVTLADGKKIKIKVFKNIYKGTFNAGSGTEITVTEEFDNTDGTFEPETSTVNLAPPANGTVTITGTGTAGDTAFNNLSLTNAGGKTLTINGKITVDNLNISGTSAASKLTVQGGTDSEITLTSDQTPDPGTKKGYYLNVNTNIRIADGKTYYVADSILGSPNPANWEHMYSTWKTNATNDNWNTASNWTLGVVPTADWPVIIPAGGVGTKYPKLTAPSAINPAPQAQSVTVNGELDLDSYTISDGSNTAPLINNSVLKMTGTPDQKAWFENSSSNDKITLGDNSTIEYYDSTNNDVWAGPYKNLSLNNRPDLKTNNENLTVNGVLTITGSGTHIDTGTGTQTYNGIITATGKDIILEGSTITTKHNITANNIKVLGDWNSNSGTITANINIEAAKWNSTGNVTATTGKIKVTGDWNSNNGTITANTNIEAANWNSEEGTITAGNDITVTGNWYSKRSIISGRNITSSGSKWTSWGGITATGNINIENELEFNGGSMAVGGNLTAEKLNTASTSEGGGSIIFNGSGTQKLSGKSGNNIQGSSIQNLKIESNANLELESDIIITVGLYNHGKFDANTNNKTVKLVHATGLTVTPTNPPNKITIKGNASAADTEFHNLECTNAGGKMLTIDGKISVNGILKLEGTSAGSLLTIAGGTNSPGIQLAVSQTGNGKWLNVHTNVPMIPEIGGYTYTATESKPIGTEQEIYTDKKPKNWIFDDCLIEMKWLGGSGTTDSEKTAWSAPKNWLPNGIPGIHTPVKIESGKTYYPKLTANVKAKTITLNGELDLDSYTISDDAGGTSRSHIDNKGKLKMTGTAGSPTDQKTWLEIPTSNIGDCITHNDSSIVEYYGSTNNNVWKGPYKNLSLNNRPDLKTNNEDLTVNGVLTVTGSGIHIKTGTGTQTYNGIITATGKDITLEGSTITTKHNITANNIKVLGDWNSNSGTITAGTNIEAAKWTSADGVITNAGNNITVTGAWDSKGSTITAKNITANNSWISSGNITASKDITGSNTHLWKSTAGNIKLKGKLTAGKFDQTGGTLTFNGTGGVQQLQFTDAINSKIKELKIDKDSNATPQINGNVKLLSDITISDKFENKGTFDANSHTVTLSPTGSTVTITGTGNSIDTKFHNLSLTNAGGKKLTINGKISVNGDLKLEGTNDGSLLSIEGGTNSSGIQLAASQTGNGKWLNVHTNIPMTPETGGKTYTVTESKAHEVPGFLISDGHPKNWIFNDYIGSMSWTALESLDADKTKWDKSKNWIPNGIPGTHTKVNIPTGINKYPKLESSTNAKAEKITLNGELDLAGYVITDTLNTAPLTNNDLLKMTGTADQKTWFENSSSNDKITLGDNSTVQYDSGSSANVFSGPYENLILNRSITAASSLTVNKKTTVNAAATITAPAQTYGGDVRINANTTFSAINSITFSHAIGASANNVTFDGNGTINTQKLSAADITVNSGTGAWTSSGSVTADNINTQRDWISSDDVTAAGNITSNNAWTASSGNIALKGNLSANQFTQTGGTLIFNGNGTPQTLLFTNPAGQKNIYNLIIDTGANLELRSDITIKRDFTNKGTFNADTHTVTLTNDADHKIIGTNTAGDTKFYNLFCEDAGDKTLTFENEIWVEKKMYLSGSYSTGIKPLNIDGNGVISLNNNHPIPGNVSITNIRQKFLRVFSNKVKIGNNKYYGTDESTDDQGTTKNNNGWVFYKTFELVNSFAIPGKNEIYLLFKNGSANNVYTELTEADLANPNFTPLIITDGSSHVYAENRLYIPERLPLPSAIKEHTFWKFTLNNSISPDWILNQNALISLDYYDRKKQKLHISDIGIDMITPQRASNSIVLRSFDASEDDKALPRLDVTILAEKKGASNNAQLYFYSKDSAEHKLWHPGTVPIGPPPRFAVPQAGTTNYGCTLENNLLKSIISEQDVHLEPNKVGGFMYIYDGWLPCARLRNSNDILSFDVWHFKIVGVQKQKGGVSIFDNVLDPYKGQETIIAAYLQKPGMLTIQIMSIDGSIIRTIERSYKAAGDHIYFWDGKNNGGNPVARGIYFVRIAGPDIDEIRKILVVKN